MNEILKFLRDLSCNNNKEWFADNKDRYKCVQQKWYDFCEELIREIGQYDDNVARLTIKDCTYRIYRDTRFSKDKSPYKTHFGVFLAPGGKNSMHAGYYFHISAGGEGGYPEGHMLAAGNYCYDPKAVKILREDISYGWEEFKTQVLDVADAAFHPSMEDALKRVPKEYPADAPYADFMRMKSYGLMMPIDDKFITAPRLAQRVATLFKTTKPMIDYINRAVDYAKEEM